MSRDDNVLVLGAGYAGLSCAFRLAARKPTLPVTVVDARDSFCERIRLHQVALGYEARSPKLGPWLAQSGISFIHTRVLGIDAKSRTVLTHEGTLSYRHLVYALGSDQDPGVPGARLHAASIASESSARSLASELVALSRGARVVIVGGGLTGLEFAAELAEMRPELEVRLVAREALGTGTLSRSGAAKVRARLLELGVHLHECVEVSEVAAGRVIGPQLTLPFDVCVWATGFAAPGLAKESGLPTCGANRLVVDATLRVPSYPEIYGVGDAAQPNVDVGAPALMSCRLGMPAGLHAAENIAREREGHAPEPWRVQDMLRCMSLGRDAGLIQLHEPNGELREFSVAGHAAAWLKEGICRGTFWTLEREAKQAAHRRGLQPSSKSTMAYAT
ncbi:MAG TPA: FAD-dependent oxidoreductase [Polyangiaceae bacterium]|nr:FAD-dependent oxidoreductase [Polyangiaceae bacterium]